MKFKIRKSKVSSLELKSWCKYIAGNINGNGHNHLFFAVSLIAIHAVFLLASTLHPLCLIGNALIFSVTKNPFYFRFSVGFDEFSITKYKFHKRFSFLGMDVYMLNFYFFAPNEKMQKMVEHSIRTMESCIKEF